MSSALPLATGIVVDQLDQWNASSIYGIVFGLVTVFLGIPGAVITIYALRKRRCREGALRNQERGMKFVDSCVYQNLWETENISRKQE